MLAILTAIAVAQVSSSVSVDQLVLHGPTSNDASNANGQPGSICLAGDCVHGPAIFDLNDCGEGAYPCRQDLIIMGRSAVDGGSGPDPAALAGAIEFWFSATPDGGAGEFAFFEPLGDAGLFSVEVPTWLQGVTNNGPLTSFGSTDFEITQAGGVFEADTTASGGYIQLRSNTNTQLALWSGYALLGADTNASIGVGGVTAMSCVSGACSMNNGYHFQLDSNGTAGFYEPDAGVVGVSGTMQVSGPIQASGGVVGGPYWSGSLPSTCCNGAMVWNMDGGPNGATEVCWYNSWGPLR